MHVALHVLLYSGGIALLLAVSLGATAAFLGLVWLFFAGLPRLVRLIAQLIGKAVTHLASYGRTRIAEWARWRTRAGVPGLLGRYCWRRLVRIGRHGQPWERRYAAYTRAWLLWCRDPDDDGWTYLSQQYPIKRTADLFAAASAVSPGGGDRSALVAFCVRHRLAPGDPVERARFYALTGQGEQRRALDPDGALIAVAYREARSETRAALRESLDDPDDLDVAVAIARTGISSARAERTPEQKAEIRHLTGQLDRLREWAGLWRLVQDMSLLDAVEAMRLMDTEWRPDARREHELFALLASADPDRLTIAANSMSAASGLELLSELVDRPQDSWQRADLETALRARGTVKAAKAAGPLYELLLGCLEYRFGADVAMGVTAAGDDDIAIADSDDPLVAATRYWAESGREENLDGPDRG
jgi:hypothetical protein